jgi:PKHD-type hydroxylase
MFIPFEIDTNSSSISTNDNFLTKEECERIINYINKNKNRKKEGCLQLGNVKPSTRKSLVRWIDDHDDKELGWFIEKLYSAFRDVNAAYYQFDLYGLTEPIQFTEYSRLNDKYDYHIDTIMGDKVRKLSSTIQLSDENSYKGCDVEIKLDNKNKILSRKQGSISVFPSYLLHRVTPLQEGTRYSLVTWIGGPKFK